jgi:lysozyme
MAEPFFKTVPESEADFFEAGFNANPNATVVRKDNGDGTVTFTVTIGANPANAGPSGADDAPAGGAAVAPAGVAAIAAAGAAAVTFEEHVTGLGLTHFSAEEFLQKGSQHSDVNSPAFGLNTAPPSKLWPNLDAVAKVLDQFRASVANPVIISSAYRSPPYNNSIGGAVNSRHMKFDALDFSVRGSPVGPADWASVLKIMRDNGVFKGGIGAYSTFVHVDTRGTNVDWLG